MNKQSLLEYRKQSLKMAKNNIGIVFSKPFEGDTPLTHIGVKLPVYLRLLELIQQEDWNAFVLTRKTYIGGGVFDGVWKFSDGKFVKTNEKTKMDLVYDRSAGVKFPMEGDGSFVCVNNRDFKLLAWDKWAAFRVIGQYMPKTLLLNSEDEIPEVISNLNTDTVVLKPFNGLKGIGIYIGDKKGAIDFKFNEKYKPYIAQEFVDTSGGIPNIAAGRHDLRVVIVNGEVVWCHVRVPVGESLLANAAQGGNLTEVDYVKVPENVKEIVKKVSEFFSTKFDNPIYSLDFGINIDGTPKIFEINDQIGFPKWEMKNRDVFLNALVDNFKAKIAQK